MYGHTIASSLQETRFSLAQASVDTQKAEMAHQLSTKIVRSALEKVYFLDCVKKQKLRNRWADSLW